MLNLRKLVKSYDDSARAYAELVPWMALVEPGIVLNKDGSLLACFEFDGVDVEGREGYEVDAVSAAAEHAMRITCDERISLWWTLDRRRTNVYPDGQFENPVSAQVDEWWRENFFAAGQFRNRHFLSVLYTPPGGIEGVFEKIAHYTKVEGLSFFAAAGETIKSSLFGRAAFRYEHRQLVTYINEFQNRLQSFSRTLSESGFRLLEEEDLLGFLHRRASPASTAERIRVPDTPAYLDAYLTGNLLVERGDTIAFRGTRDRHAAAVSIKGWPRRGTMPGVIDGLLAMPFEVTVSQVMRISSLEKTRKYIQDVERHNRNMSKPLKAVISEAFTHQESQQLDIGRVAMANDASEAMTSLSTDSRIFGHYNFTVFAFGESEREADAMAREIQGYLDRIEFVSVRETMHLMSCYAGSMPGQAGALVRWHFVSTGNLADLAPVRGLGVGDPHNRHFTEQFSTPDQPIPSLTALPTEFATPYYFNFHQSDLAHTLVVGPSRKGKSTFVNFLITQHQKYTPCHTFIFDKDYSCRIPTILQGGTHVDLAGEHGGKVALNPLKLVGDKNNWAWITKWLELLITSRGYQITAEDDISIGAAITNMAGLPESEWRLLSLALLLPKHLHEQLRRWVGDGPLARFFDNDDDTFSLGAFNCMEMGRLFDEPIVARAFIEYAFYRIARALDGRPALIYVEEAWFMLEDDRFAAGLNNWLRTLAKKNAWVVMATQSLDELARSDVFVPILENMPNRIYLPNPEIVANRELYSDKFGLNEEQMRRIQHARPKLHYYITTPLLSRMVEVSLPPHILAVVRSDAKAQKVFNRHQASNDPHWMANYLEEMVNG
ncbi:MAG: type IV secretion system protein TrbE [Azoarcus sp.]|nr:type IV secretion system protein TrbE [Azoarcus sp.]